MPDSYITIPFRLEITSKFLNYFSLPELNARGWDILALLLIFITSLFTNKSVYFVADVTIYSTDAIYISRCKSHLLLDGIQGSTRLFSLKVINKIIQPFTHNPKTFSR